LLYQEISAVSQIYILSGSIVTVIRELKLNQMRQNVVQFTHAS